MSTPFGVNLVRTPDICGGRLRIDGTRMTVNQIVTLFKQGLTAEEITWKYPQRQLSEIHAVLSWYFTNRDAFDKELAEEAAGEAEAESAWRRQQRP